MNESIFRKKSLDKLKSPDNLNDYVRVTDPGVWLLLAAILILLLGACVWGIFGHIESVVDADIQVTGGIAQCMIAPSDIERVEPGMTVRADSFECAITEIGSIEGGSIVCALTAVDNVEDGYYSARVITESIRPASLILN